MAHQKKYFYQYTTLADPQAGTPEKTCVVELWEDSEAVIVAEEITGANMPFMVELPEIDHKFQVVRGKGCDLQFISETDMKFYTSLYHEHPQKFQVRHYVDSVLDFAGYLNSEMYTEPYDVIKNYIVNVTGNDGFALMDRFSFLQADLSNYTGVKSKWEILQILLDRIDLPWSEVRVSLSTTFTGFSGAASSTILHESYIDCANFYDEDNKPMSLRAVMESILAPYGAFIHAESGNIYITDIHSIGSGGSITWQRFDASTYSYIANIAETIEKTISSIGYRGTGHSIERSGGINRQVVSYSPYPVKEVLPESITGFDEFGTVPGAWSAKNGYNYKTLSDNPYWNVFSPATFEASYYNDESSGNLYLRWPVLPTNQKIADIKLNEFINVEGATTQIASGRYGFENGLMFNISLDTLVKTKTNPYNDSLESTPISSIVLSFRIKVGNKYYQFNRTTGLHWTTTIGNARIFLYASDFADEFVTPNDNFTTTRVIDIFIGNINSALLLSGDFTFEIWSDIETKKPGSINYDVNPSYASEVWVKNIAISMKRINGEEIPDQDIEFIGNLNSVFQNEGEKITLTTGSNSQFSDRAKIMYSDGNDYQSLTEWTRASQTFKIEELLLGSVSSNYRMGFVTLNNMKLNNTFNIRNVLTDSFIHGTKLMIKSARINYRDNLVECTLTEVKPDELIIIK